MQLKKNQTLRNLSIRERSWLFQKKNFQKKKIDLYDFYLVPDLHKVLQSIMKHLGKLKH